MGNQRHQLKENIAIDLRKKIENTQFLLGKLNSEYGAIANSSEGAKEEIQNMADHIIQQLTQRKLTLLKEVEVLTQKEMSALQANIQNTYLTLGSLQSMLSNLESFDDRQLLHLRIPMTPNLAHVPSPNIEATVSCEQLLEKIDRWGCVGSQNTGKHIHQIETEKHTGEKAHSQWLRKPAKEAEKSPAPTPEFSDVHADLMRRSIQEWLEGKARALAGNSESDDFEMLSLENELDCIRRHSAVDDSVVPDMNDIKHGSEVVSGCDDSTSSIVCVGRANSIQRQEDCRPALDEMTIWLKPKAIKTVAAPSSNTRQILKSASSISMSSVAPVPSEMISSEGKSSTISSKSLYLDYPGLRLDPHCWLKKKSKINQDIFKFSEQISLNMSEKDIIPPTYAALPYPFWLRRCC